MSYLALALSAALSTAGPAAHEVSIDHRDAVYQVTYRPQVETRMKTVGLSAGTRPSSERCRWTMAVQVERQIRRQGQPAGIDRLLPDAHLIRGERAGSCAHGRDAIAAEQVARTEQLRAHVAQVAAADRATVLADIDSAHALASN
jgi:hypothetical protein